MFTRGIIYEGIKYIEIINDTNNIRKKSFEDFVYCILVEISMNTNNEEYSSKADNYKNILTNFVNFPRTDLFSYSNVLNNKLFLQEFNEWLKSINSNLFDFESIPIYDCSINLIDYTRYDIWISEINFVKKELNKRINSSEKIACMM